MTDKTFIKITNRDIYDKLESIEKHVLQTNGKVKLNRWISTTALSLVFAMLFGLMGVKLL